MSIKELIRKLTLRVKTMIWALPPAGGFINPFQVLFSALGNGRDGLQHLLEQKYPNHELFFLNSGKSALYLVYNNLKIITRKDVVALPSYTCPDVASSAVRAGLRVWLLDFQEGKNLEVACPSKEEAENFICTVGTNLFGLDDSSDLRAFSLDNGIFHIEDVCQAALSNFGERESGVCESSIGIMSFGRGKAYCGAGGGLLMIPRNSKYEALISEMHYQFREIPKAHFFDSLQYILKLTIFWLLERPNLYWLVRLIPFTGLGETKLKLEFPIRKASTMELAAMEFGIRNRDVIRSQKSKVLAYYKEVQSKKVDDVSEVLIRLPVILTKDARNKLAKKYKTFMNKYGISFCYPKCIDAYGGMAEHVINQSSNRALSIAEGIVTLPLHRHVRRSNVKKIITLISELKRETNA